MATPVRITPGRGSFTDSAGNVYTIDSAGNAMENGNAMAGGGGTSAMELYNNIVYAQDSSSGTWFTWDGSTFTAASAPPDSGTSPTPSPPSTSGPTTTPGTRNWWENPGGDGTFWVTPFYNSAQFITSGNLVNTLRAGNKGFLHSNVTDNSTSRWWVGTASDPLCTITDGTITFQARVPAGAFAEGPYNPADQNMGGCDRSQPY